MADINKENIKLMQSQRLDDTDQGGGQMTSDPVLDGEVNNLFPDISRLDRVYGRVSMRKAYLAVQTPARETYYGSHTIITQQALDPNVSVCFFSSNDWFDTRDAARDRIEAYLVKGPSAQMNLWSQHYTGTSSLSFFTNVEWPVPEIGDVLVLKDATNEQYVRVIDSSYEIREFFDQTSAAYDMKIVSITIGSQLAYDFVGEEVVRNWSSFDGVTEVLTTVAADASRYYGITTLAEDAIKDSLQVRVDDVYTNLVPSAASETAITDSGVGSAISPLIQTKADDGSISVIRTISYDIRPNSKLYVGEGVDPGSFSWVGGLSMDDRDGKGNIYTGESLIIGSISYATGVITFGNTVPSTYTGGGGIATYIPACTSNQVSQTGAIEIETNNRGFVYTFNCNPIPQKGTVKVDYLAGGKWYSLWDQGNGQLLGSDAAIGSGVVNFITGSLSVTLGAMPDISSKVIIYWAKPSEYFDLSGETLPLKYNFYTQHQGVTRNTFSVKWSGDTVGAFDNGNGALTYRTWDGATWTETGEECGSIKYATGEIDLRPIHVIPTASENFRVEYNYGDPEEVTFVAPPRDAQGHINLDIVNTPIIPNTFRIEWHTFVEEYEPDTRIDMSKDPTYIFYDDGIGGFDGDVDDGTTNWIPGTVDYSTGVVQFHPDRFTIFPSAQYIWTETAWLHPGVEESRVFDKILYLPAMSTFPTDGNVMVSYSTTDGLETANYTGTLESGYFIGSDKAGVEIIPGGLGVYFGDQYLVDGTDGKLYTHSDGVTNERLEVGRINYVEKSITITSDSINQASAVVDYCSGSGRIEPMQTLVFRAPGAPIRPGSAFIKGTTSTGRIIEGNTDFDGLIVGEGITGHVDFNTGLCHVVFGEYVLDDAEAQASEWYNPNLVDGSNVWKPFVVRASTILMNCVVTSYLPLDPDLLGLDPVRLPMDGKVPIFRDGYIIVVHNSTEEYMPYPLGDGTELPADTLDISVGRTNVDLIEAYSVPTTTQFNEGVQTVPKLIDEVGNWTFDLELGTIKFLSGFVYPIDSEGVQNEIIALSRVEDMCLASDVQVTGHIAITSPLTHDYTAGETMVSSVLPSADLQSRAYNEFEQNAWSFEWSDTLIGTPPLASYNFVDYPISVTNAPSIKERWLILFKTDETVDIIGENFGVLTPEPVSIIAGNETIGGNACIAVGNRNFPGEYYFVMRCDGFGSGWQSGNCIRFNEDAANFPLWFVRTTLQAPPQEATDHYTIQIRGDSS